MPHFNQLVFLVSEFPCQAVINGPLGLVGRTGTHDGHFAYIDKHLPKEFSINMVTGKAVVYGIDRKTKVTKIGSF